jgi:8-amino-7-oxononanoate synthase
VSAIAIVGMGCRFAGAENLLAYWEMTVAGRDAFGPVPPDRWPAEAFFDTNRRATDKTYAPAGAFIQDIHSFPALALGLPPRRVEVMDPQQRLSLEVALAAIEDAGYTAADLPRRTGVFMGVTATEYRSLTSLRVAAALLAAGTTGQAPADPTPLARAVDNLVPSRPYTASGALGNMCAALIAQELDLRGPAYTTDAACASAHMAVYDAVHQLRSGAIDAALAGGVYLQITPDHYLAFARIGAMSASGTCRPFDHRNDGFVQGDGGGIVLLKRLDDALRDGDRIYAVIHGVGINNDGRGDGPMAPLAEGQAEVIRAAWTDAGLDPATLGYVEAHGTGTSVGDPTEIQGLTQVFGQSAAEIALGSSKGNVGHTMSAAGIAGLIRAALAVHHGVVPPMAGFEAPSAALGLDGLPFRVPTRAERWDATRRVAGCSAFGFGGTNGHIVLADAPAQAPAPVEQPELVLLSAGSEADLRTLAAAIASAVEAAPAMTVASVARAMAGRRRQAWRASLVASTRDALLGQLRALAAGESAGGVHVAQAPDEPARVAFLYPGQGAQRTGMLRDARGRFPALARRLATLEQALDGALPQPLTHLIYPELRPDPVPADVAEEQLTDTACCQPAMLAVGLALTDLLAEVGVRPHVVTGHSLGEFTAAAAAGVLSADDAARFVAARGRAMAALPGDHGAMAAIMADRDTAASFLVDGAIVANINHPRQVVVSGLTPAVAEVVARATAADVKAVALQVSHGFHGPALAGLDSAPLLDGVAFSDPKITVASGISDRPYAGAYDARGVFLRHATSPVDFVGALAQCRDAGANVYLQVGAGGPLAAFARGGLPRDHRGVLTIAGREDDDGGASILDALAQLWVRGVDLDVRAITAPAPLATLPPTILPRERYWAVKDEPQLPLELAGARSRAEAAPAPAAAPPPPAEAAPGAPAADAVADRVLAVIAKVSAYPTSALRPNMALVEDLGFDSLMVGDLASGLSDAFETIQGIPQELLINRPTVQDIIDFARQAEAGGGPAAHDDDDPLTGYAVGWTPAPRPALPGRSLPRGHAVLVVDAPDAVAAALRDAGADVATCSAAQAATARPASLIVWGALEGGPSIADVVAGRAAAPDRATPLLAALAAQGRQGAHPDLVVLTRDGDPWAGGVRGVARALRHEWAGVSSVALHLDDAAIADVAGLILADWQSADRSSDVRYVDGVRAVPALAPHPDATEPATEGAVLITGGTRGIGLQLAAALLADGDQVVLVGRSAPGPEATALLDAHAGRCLIVRADVTDGDALRALAADLPPIRAVVHAAGSLADGPVDQVDPAVGVAARRIKVDGLLHAIAAAGPSLRTVVGVGSWAGRLGNRHQAHYAAANAAMADLIAALPGVHGVTLEFGPWTTSDMVRTIPAPVQAAMRAEGVDFVGDAAGLAALRAGLAGQRGAVVLGRDLTPTLRAVEASLTLSTTDDPYLLDHAIEGVPVLPLAAACDLMAWAADAHPPFALTDVRLFQGVTVSEPVALTLLARGDKVELRQGPRRALAYQGRIRPLSAPIDDPGATKGGAPPTLPLAAFYDGLTFHGPMLQGITAIDRVGDGFVAGRVRVGSPRAWSPGSARDRFVIDPLAFDSAMQLSAYVAWVRYQRAGTPVALGRYAQLAAFPADGEVVAEVTFGPIDGDRFTGTVWFRDPATGALLAVAEDVVAELRAADADAAPAEPAEAPFEVKPEWVDASRWPEVKDLQMRLSMAEMAGIRNPYFRVQQGTARDTTVIDGREYINFSSYNYIGLSGDPRVLAAVHEAVDRYGTSVSASRVASGERPFHQELERELAASQRAEDALVFTAGHATNVTTIGHLFGKDDLIIHDEYIHDSGLQGIKLSGAARRAFRHDDPDACEAELRKLRRHYRRCLILVEGVYSMDGDICALPRYVALKRQYGAMLMVDEAHSYGVIGATGQGAAEHFDLAPGDVDIWMGTLSKSLASCGGWIAGTKPLITYLRYTAPGFVYSAGLTAANGVAALSSLRLMLAEPWRVRQLQDNARFFQQALVARGVDTGPAHGESGVVPAITGNSMWALQLAQRLNEAGINVQPIVYPAVPDDAARLRFFLSSTHSEAQLLRTAELTADTLARVQAEFPLPKGAAAARR